MTRGLESILSKALNCLAVAFILCAIGLGIKAFATKDSLETAGEHSMHPANTKLNMETANPNLSKLSKLKMSKTVMATVEVLQKPAAPALGTLIHVKGLMDFGGPNTVEAIIESVKENKTKSYKNGEAIEGVNAVITKIDSAVTLNYDGTSVTLNVYSGESAEIPPTAGTNGSQELAEQRSLHSGK